MTDVKQYCKEYAKEIYVREFVNGTWKSVPLAKLPEDAQEKYITEWSDEGFLPSRVK